MMINEHRLLTMRTGLCRYAMFCYWTKFEIHGLVGGLVYTMHTLLGCTLLGLCTGALGFLSAYAVVKKIYAAVKVFIQIWQP